MTTDSPEGTRLTHSPSVAAFLSFIWPGLGQLYERRRSPSCLDGAYPLEERMVALVRGINETAIQRCVLGPPNAVHPPRQKESI